MTVAVAQQAAVHGLLKYVLLTWTFAVKAVVL